MHKSKKAVGILAAGAAIALSLSGCAGNDPAPGGGEAPVGGGEYSDVIDVNFGYIPDYNGMSLLAIAEDQGYWDKYGINVTTQNFTNGPLQIQALGTGDLDFGYIGPGAVWLPASGQAKIIALNTLGQADRVVAQAGIESVEDLRGKTVAYPEGTSGDMILSLALEAAGMTKDDVNAVTMEPAAIVSALASKQVDGAGFWYPALATVEQQVPDLVTLAENSDFEDTMAFPTAFVAGNDVVADEPEKVDRVLKALRDATEFRAANMEESIALTADFASLDAEAVAADAANVQILSLEELDKLTEDGTIDTWLSGMVDFFVESGKLTEPAEPSDFYTGDLFVQAGE